MHPANIFKKKISIKNTLCLSFTETNARSSTDNTASHGAASTAGEAIAL